MRYRAVCWFVFIFAFANINAQSLDDFWKHWTINNAKIIEAPSNYNLPPTNKFPKHSGISIQWNNSAYLIFSSKAIVSQSETTNSLSDYFMIEQNKIPWIEFFEGDFTILDSTTSIQNSTAWNTGIELTGHIKKGFGITTEVGYIKLNSIQNNFLNILPFVPTTETTIATLRNERISKSVSFFLGATYQFLKNRVQPAVSFGYQLNQFRSEQLVVSHLALQSMIPNKTKSTYHGWRMQLMIKVFLIKGWYIAPNVQLGQLFKPSLIHTVFNAGAGIGYQLDMNRKE